MAEDTKPKDAQQPAQTAPAAAPEPEPEPDMAFNETIPGGKFMQGGVMVNAWGQPIDSKGNVKKSGE
jgi:hypothetical protein